MKKHVLIRVEFSETETREQALRPKIVSVLRLKISCFWVSERNRVFIADSYSSLDSRENRHKSNEELLQEASDAAINQDGYYDFISPEEDEQYSSGRRSRSGREIALIAGLGVFCVVCIVVMVNIIINFHL